MKLVRVVFLGGWVVMICAILIMNLNPFGWGQRLFFNQRPPYRWVQLDVARNSVGSMDEEYKGANDDTCARVSRFALFDSTYNVFGYGFNVDYATKEEAERKAEKECR